MIYAGLKEVTLSGVTFPYCNENPFSRAQNIVYYTKLHNNNSCRWVVLHLRDTPIPWHLSYILYSIWIPSYWRQSVFVSIALCTKWI